MLNLNDTTSNNEQITVYTAEYRDGKATTVEEIGTLYEDLLDLSKENEITIRWVAANLTCQTAMRRNATYACLSMHSNCLHVYRGNTPLGYRCKCNKGFQGNPYIKDECTGQNSLKSKSHSSIEIVRCISIMLTI